MPSVCRWHHDHDVKTHALCHVIRYILCGDPHGAITAFEASNTKCYTFREITLLERASADLYTLTSHLHWLYDWFQDVAIGTASDVLPRNGELVFSSDCLLEVEEPLSLLSNQRVQLPVGFVGEEILSVFHLFHAHIFSYNFLNFVYKSSIR